MLADSSWVDALSIIVIGIIALATLWIVSK